MAKTKAKSTLSEISSKMREDAQRFDEVLRELVESGESLTYDVLLFGSQLGLDPPSVRAQYRRMSRVLSFQQVAGTSKDRTELLAAADDAEQVLKTDGEQLLAQIAELQKQYSAMESKAKQLRRRHDQAADAVRELKDLVPDVVKEEFSLRRRILNETVRTEISERETRLRYLELLLNQQDYTDQAWLETVRLNDSGFIGYSGDRVQRRILLPAFEQSRPKLQQELNEIRSELEQLRKQFDAERKSMDETLEVYSK